MKIFLLTLLALAPALAWSEASNQLNDRGLEATEKKQFAAAEQLFTQAIEQWRAKGPAYDAHVAIVLTNLAQVYAAQGQRERCAATLEESLALYRRTLGIRDLRALTTLNLLAGIDLMLGKYDAARALLTEALPVERESYPRDGQLARTLSAMASLALQEDRGADAVPYADEALTLTLAAEGENSLDGALAYANLAETHRVNGEYSRAEPLFRKALAIYERLLGPNHPRVSSVLTQQGLMAMHDGKLATADQLFKRSLAILDAGCPTCAYEYSAAQNDLALLRIRQKRYDEAGVLLSDVLARQGTSDRLPGPEIAVTLRSLAEVRQKEHRYKEAERLRRRADVLGSALR